VTCLPKLVISISGIDMEGEVETLENGEALLEINGVKIEIHRVDEDRNEVYFRRGDFETLFDIFIPEVNASLPNGESVGMKLSITQIEITIGKTAFPLSVEDTGKTEMLLSPELFDRVCCAG